MGQNGLLPEVVSSLSERQSIPWVFSYKKSTFSEIINNAVERQLIKCVFLLISAHCAAYDTVDREQLWQGKHEYGFPDKLTRLIKATMDLVMC